MLHDLRYALRMMRLHPWFSAAIVAALALGIGANTAVFTLVNAVLFKPLPFPGGERIVAIFHQNESQGRQRVPLSYADYLEYRDVAGVKIPSRWTVSWVSGRSHFELTSAEPNVPVPAQRFARPNLPQTLFQ